MLDPSNRIYNYPQNQNNNLGNNNLPAANNSRNLVRRFLPYCYLSPIHALIIANYLDNENPLVFLPLAEENPLVFLPLAEENLLVFLPLAEENLLVFLLLAEEKQLYG